MRNNIVISIHFILWNINTCQTALEDKYMGCFRNFGNQMQLPPTSDSKKMTINSCIEECEKQNTTFAGLQVGSVCFCGDEFNGSSPEENCQLQCSGNSSQNCGGATDKYTSVYSVCNVGYYEPGCDSVCHCQRLAPCNRMSGVCPTGCDKNWEGSACGVPKISPQMTDWYVGCYKDSSETPAMETKNPGGITGSGRINSIQICLGICTNFSYTYMGLQYYYDCNCGEQYARYGPSDDCSYPCQSNNGQICGGYYANSVYSVCPRGSFAVNCIKQCNCLNNTRCIFGNGSCLEGCQPGWTGKSCNIRDCKEANGSCSGQNETCETVNLKYATVTRCGCTKGYSRYKPWDDCVDIDECIDQVSVCGAKVYNCTNTDGGFICGYCPEDLVIFNGTCTTQMGFIQTAATGVLIGAVLGSILAIILIAIIVAVVLYYRKKIKYRSENRRNSANNFATAIERNSEMADIIAKENNECQYANIETVSTKIKVEDLAKFVKTLEATHGVIDKEFKSVPLDSKAASNCGKRKEVKKKNRFKNIIPYDYNRVILSKLSNQQFSDYINASFVSGYSSSDNLIATQGPTPESIEDFWRMIFEKNIGVIVMITNLEENSKKKCEKYWPEMGEMATFGDVTVSVLAEHSWPDYTRRSMQAVQNSKTLELVQWHYTSWPDHGVPSNGRSFLALRRKVRNSISSDKFTMIHCSAGAGRTGSYIAIDYLLEQAKSGYVDVLGCLQKLRQQRTQMIQTLEQYKFVYATLVDQFSTGDTVLPSDSFHQLHNELRNKDRITGKSKLDLQYQMLGLLNEEKETDRVILKSSKSDDFRAFYVQSHRKKDHYIVTTAPSSATSEELWTMCIDCKARVIVFINDIQDFVPFIPTKASAISTEHFTLVLCSTSKESNITVCKMSLLSKSESVYANTVDSSTKDELTLVQVYSTSSANGDFVDYESLSSAHKTIKRLANTENKLSSGPCIIMSQNSESLSGFCLSAFNAFDMIQEDDEVDIYQIVHDLRKSNSHFIPSMDAYQELYNVVEKYIEDKS